MSNKKRYSDIKFERASLQYKDTIFHWLAEPHMREFWDNTQEHKDDILNFIHGRPQHYFYGTTRYWVGLMNHEPYSLILSDIFFPEQDLSALHQNNMSVAGHTIGLDFGIGNKKYLGCGLAVPTLQEFMSFYKKSIDPFADTFFIDPDPNNPRAIHVYAKAGFEQVGEYKVTSGAFKGSMSSLMVKKI